MLAVGFSYDQAQAFCSQPQFAGRIGVAASNAPASVTISDDADAIAEAKETLDGQGTFARPLRVDRAYHSNHTLEVLPFLRAYLEGCKITVGRPSARVASGSDDLDVVDSSSSNDSSSPVWISTLYGNDDLVSGDEIRCGYWLKSATDTVLFSQAVEASLVHGPLDLIMEIGPHAALRGPTIQTITAALGSSPPYTSVLKRGEDAIQAFSSSLGHVWENVGRPLDMVRLDLYQRTFRSGVHHGGDLGRDIDRIRPAMVVKGLPAYQWDQQRHWHESRMAANLRLRGGQPPNELLGRRCPYDSDSVMRWRNLLCLEELPWLQGHAFQGAAVFPMAGYAAVALEAALAMAGTRRKNTGPALLLDEILEMRVEDLVVHESLSLESCGKLETLVILTERKGTGTPSRARANEQHDTHEHDTLAADFTFEGCALTDGSKIPPELGRYCSARVVTSFVPDGHDDVDVDHVSSGESSSAYAIIAALYPAGSTRFESPILPVKMGRLVVSPRRVRDFARRCNTVRTGSSSGEEACGSVGTVSVAAYRGPRASPVACVSTQVLLDVDAESDHVVQKDRMVAFRTDDVAFRGVLGEQSASRHDVSLFYHNVTEPDVMSPNYELSPAQDDSALYYANIETLERLTMCYIRRIVEGVSVSQQASFPKWHHRHMTSVFRRRLLAHDEEQQHQYRQDKDYDDNFDAMLAQLEAQDVVNARLVRAVGENAPPGPHRYPRMKFFEVGGGTGGTTKYVLEALAGRFRTYTFTDISAGFFARSEEKLSKYDDNCGHGGKIEYRVLDIERDPTSQGFTNGAYDLIMAANCVHATKSLGATLSHLRGLLRPGGFLVLFDITGDPIWLSYSFVFGGLDQWSAGASDDGRVDGPGVSRAKWDSELRKSGFSGLDQAVPFPRRREMFSVMLMTELDMPLFAHLSGDTLASFKLLLRSSRYFMVVTRRCRDENPDSNMLVGVLRALIAEMPHVRFQCIDIDDLDVRADNLDRTSGILSASLLRMVLAPLLEDEPSHEDDNNNNNNRILWSMEPELLVRDGCVQIPRVVKDKAKNDRLNSSTRLIKQETYNIYEMQHENVPSLSLFPDDVVLLAIFSSMILRRTELVPTLQQSIVM
ncbi:lovastatin nonaketide synthase [Colletotrichum higginsianum]|uniref:Lovastatin nonaketide synthase n=1 Tax=Colletotrichum higginsianum (strain IMI 349063) TaxID=759273 RepID=H1UV24_COLHI|nr:lovastatin nonaketide synthase [Colletotrichum higginsianum]